MEDGKNLVLSVTDTYDSSEGVGWTELQKSVWHVMKELADPPFLFPPPDASFLFDGLASLKNYLHESPFCFQEDLRLIQKHNRKK